MATESRWGRRLGRRWPRRVERVSIDLGNALSWHLLGGQRRASAAWRDWAAQRRWVFLIGCNNSGTSLLQRLIERLGPVSTFAAEGQRYTRALRRDDRREHARVWSRYLDELALGASAPLDAAPRLLHDWLRHLRTPLQPVILEKTPANTARALWLQRVFPDARFIGLMRNGYAVSEGIRRKAGHSVVLGATHWAAVNALLLDQAAELEHYLEVRYEDLAAHPDAVLARLRDFIGLSPPARLADVPMDLQTPFGRVHDYNAASLARLNAFDRDAIRRHAGAMLERLGYAADGP